MSSSITEAQVQSFRDEFRILGQQMPSRFRNWCQVDSGIVGASKAMERIGASEAYDITSRHADTKYVDTPHSRRWCDMQDKGWADLVDEMDKIKMLGDPTSPYQRIGNAALNRSMDTIILTAARGNSRTNTSVIALPAGQKIAEGGTGLTLSKLFTTKEILDAAEIDDMEDEDGQKSGKEATRVIACSARQITNLLNTTEIKSVDYNNVKALAQGQIDTFMGFKFKRTERLAKSGTTRFCTAWIKGCVGLGIGKDIVSNIDVLPGKNYSVQVYARMSIGATRLEDEGVVEIGCFE